MRSSRLGAFGLEGGCELGEHFCDLRIARGRDAGDYEGDVGDAPADSLDCATVVVGVGERGHPAALVVVE